MTENEAKKLINDIHSQYCDEANILCTTDADNRCIALEIAIKALEGIQQYRAIGTVEECRAAVENDAKRVIKKHKVVALEDIAAFGADALLGKCPVCKELVNNVWNERYCGDCGQKLNWGDEE